MDKAGVAVGLATISVVGAAILFAAERVLTGPMDVIERHLGFSPDGADGSMEILVAVMLVVIIVVLDCVWRQSKAIHVLPDTVLHRKSVRCFLSVSARR